MTSSGATRGSVASELSSAALMLRDAVPETARALFAQTGTFVGGQRSATSPQRPMAGVQRTPAILACQVSSTCSS